MTTGGSAPRFHAPGRARGDVQGPSHLALYGDRELFESSNALRTAFDPGNLPIHIAEEAETALTKS
jgi:hypothetical protein